MTDHKHWFVIDTPNGLTSQGARGGGSVTEQLTTEGKAALAALAESLLREPETGPHAHCWCGSVNTQSGNWSTPNRWAQKCCWCGDTQEPIYPQVWPGGIKHGPFASGYGVTVLPEVLLALLREAQP